MTNKQKFWDWIRASERLSANELKQYKTAYKQAHRRMHLYDLNSVDEVRRADIDGNLELYCEFLSQINSGDVSADIKENDIVDSDNLQQLTAEADNSPSVDEGLGDLSWLDNTFDSAFAENETAASAKTIDFYGYIDAEQDRLALNASLFNDAVADARKENENRYAYDVSTCSCCDVSEKTVRPMSTFVVYVKRNNTEKKPYPCKKTVFYYSKNCRRLLGASVALRDSNVDIITNAVEETARKYGVADSYKKSICIMPDTLGEFGDGVKKQISRLGGNFVAVPRSVIAAYSYIAAHKNCTDLYVYDLDLPEPYYTHVAVSKEEDGQIALTRMERRKSAELTDCSAVNLSARYLADYVRANGFTLDMRVAENLINSGDMLRVMRNDGSVLVQASDGQYKTISYSEELMNNVRKMVVDKINGVEKKSKDELFLLSFGAKIPSVMTLSDTFGGCAEVLRRIDAGRVIWKEYLPELALEVIKDGRLSKLWLVKKGSKRSVDIMASEGDITVHIDDGIFTIPAHTKEVSLPLEREEFGETVRDKMAKFSGNVLPVYEETEVELSFSYSYGDPDSYKLSARGVNDKSFVVVSEWCDEDKSDNVSWPEYNENEQVKTSELDLSAATELFDNIQNRISDVVNLRYYLNVYEINGYIESNIFKHKMWYSPNLIKKVTETVNYDGECKATLDAFFESMEFNYIYEYLVNPESSALYRAVNHDADLKDALDVSLLVLTSTLGVFYSKVEGNYIRKQREELLKLFVKKAKEGHPEYLFNASRCLSDRRDIMRAVSAYIEKYTLPKTLRNISAVCWYNKEWIHSLYDVSPQAVKIIEDCCLNFLINGAESKLREEKAPLFVRDVMETALAVCRLREKNVAIFDVKAQRVKTAVESVENIDKIICGELFYIKHKFKSRVNADWGQKAFYGVEHMSDPCFLLWTQLTGKRHLKLLGFAEK